MMIKFWIICLLVTTAVPIISSTENDQQMASSKNIKLYVVPRPGLKSYISEPKQTVYQESETPYQTQIPAYTIINPEHLDDHKIAIKVLKEDQKSYVDKPSYKVVGYSQSHPKLDFKNPEDLNTKYALEPEGPKQTKVTVNVIKEQKKTFAVDPSYIENEPSITEYHNKPEVTYQTVEAAYSNSETVNKESDPEYTKYIQIKEEDPKERNVYVKVKDDTGSDPEYTKYIQIKEEDPKERNVYVKVVKDDTKTFIAEPRYKSDMDYHQPEYREIKTLYQNNEPRYVIKEDEPRQKEIIVRVVKEDEKSIDKSNPTYISNNAEPDYRKVTKYRKSEQEPKYVKYEVRREEPKVIVKVVKEDKNTDHLKYERDSSHSDSVYKKSVTEYRKLEPAFRTSEFDFKKYEDKEDNQDKKVFVVNEDKKIFAVESKHKNDDKYLEPVFKRTEYRRLESDYNKYTDRDREDKKKKVFVKDVKDKNTFDDNSKYENDQNYFEPEYTKYGTEYEKSDPDYRISESGSVKYEGKERETREKKVCVKGDKENENTYGTDSECNNDTYVKPEYRKPIMEYEKHEQELRKSDSEYRNSDKADYDSHGDNDEEDKTVTVDQNNENDPKYENDEIYENDHRKDMEPEYSKYETEYKESKPNLKSDNIPNHDVLIKIWRKTSN